VFGRAGSTLRPASRRLDLLLVVAVALTAWLVLRGPSDQQEFSIDESRWISTSRYFWTTFQEWDLAGPTWQPNYLVLTQPPVARYVLGLGLALQGWSPDQLGGRYDNFRDREYNVRAGNVPGPELLAAARRVNLLLAVGVVLLLYGIGRVIAGPVCGLLAAGLALANPLLSTLWTRALAEAPLGLFSLLSLLLAMLAARRTLWQPGGVPLYVGAGLALGLAAATKLSGLLGALGLANFALLRVGTAPGRRWKSEALGWLLLGTVAALTFILLNPLLYPDPIGRTLMMLDHRRLEMQVQQRRWPDDAVPPVLTDRAAVVAERVFVDWAGLPRLPLGLLEVSVTALGVGASVSAIARRCDDGRRLGPRALLLNWTLLLYTGAIANLGFDSSHYYAPLVTANTLLQAIGLAAALSWLMKRGTVIMSRKPR
jgi:4-amino-4-deoxy-L-arabinose transferase-like glycosyltransferase